MSAKHFDIHARVAIVTGAGHGLGRAMALGLAEAGADVAILDPDTEAAVAAVADIEALGRRALALPVDVSRMDEVNAAFARVVAELGAVDILVNNAGLWSLRPALELPLDEWDRVLAVNLTGVLHCCRAAGRLMREQERGGSIINIASISGVLGFKERVAYAATKHGVLGITKSLANEWATSGVRVNAIGPGVHRTRMTEEWRRDPAVMKELLRNIPMARMGEPEELVGPVVFLASDASSYVTGQTLFVDGGWLLQ